MSDVLSCWKRFVARKTGIEWQKGFFDHRLRQDESLEEKTQYIRMNPVRAGLVQRPEDWPHVWAFNGRDGSPLPAATMATAANRTQDRIDGNSGCLEEAALPAVDALLLLGPTGSGKTPLGEYLERHGLAGRRCVHFDFGEQLRRAAAGASELDPSETAQVRDVLGRGALLEDRQFPIAEKILRSFLRREGMGSGDVVVLNGLPRHSGQASAMASLLRVRQVLLLECTADVVRQRIRGNSGGDRAGRVDDSPVEVSGKLCLFAQRTAPLVSYYTGRGIPVARLAVDVGTRPEDLWTQISI
jgi:adenylate kinase family enzyme